MEIGKAFTRTQVTSALAEFDLREYPYGLQVTLKQLPGGGRYLFTGNSFTSNGF